MQGQKRIPRSSPPLPELSSLMAQSQMPSSGSSLAIPPFMSIFLFLFFCNFSLGSETFADKPRSDPSIQERTTLFLGEGEQRLLRIPRLLKYSIGSKVVRVLPLSDKKSGLSMKNCLLIKAVSPGSGDLWIWKQDGSTEYRTIHVEKRIASRKNPELDKALSKLEEAEVIFTGQGVVLRGVIHHLHDATQIAALVRNYPKDIHDETEMAEPLLQEAISKLEKWLKKSGYEHSLRLEQAGQSLWIRGHLERPKELPFIEKQLLAVFPRISFEIEVLPDHSPTIYFRVFLLELKRTQFHTIGIHWGVPNPFTYQVTPSQTPDPFQLDLTLQQLEGNGHARVLSNPELVVRAPGEAELFAGGEIPIQAQSRYYSNVTWKNYGLTLKLKVTHTSGSRIRLEIFTEVSHLDRALSQDQIPGIQSNRMKTQVDAKLGTPLLLSGLLQQDLREEVKGLPFLRKIPVLGLLFGSEDYLNERSELVAILYPHGSPPPTPMHRAKQILPKGPIPPPRNWINPEEEQALRKSENFPWNALE